MAIKLTFNPEPNSEPKSFPKLMWNKEFGCLFYMVSATTGLPLDDNKNWAYGATNFFTSWEPSEFEDYDKSVTIQNK